MEMSIPYRIFTKIQKDGNIQRDKGRHRENIKAVVPAERDRNNRGRVMPGSYPYADKRTAEIQYIINNGILKGKE